MICRLIVIILAAVLSSTTSVYAKDAEAYEHSYIWDYQGKKFTTTLPSKTLQASPDFSLDSKQLPKTFREILTIAKSQLIKITKSDEGLRLSTISLRPVQNNPNKWFYMVNFECTVPEPACITILVTTDGNLGVVKEIQERIIE